MKHFAKLLKNNQGVSIVEILLALAISTIVLGIAYGLFFTGMKTYEKIGIEQAMRDEADYVVSQIMQEFYNGEISDIKNKCQPPPVSFYSEPPESANDICIEIHRTLTSKVSTNDDNKVGIASFNELKDKDSLTITQIKIVRVTVDGKDIDKIVIDDYKAEKNGDKIRINEEKPIRRYLHAENYGFIVTPKGEKTAGSQIKATCSYESAIITYVDDSDPKKPTKKLIDKKCTNGIVDMNLIIKRAKATDDTHTLELKSQFGF